MSDFDTMAELKSKLAASKFASEQGEDAKREDTPEDGGASEENAFTKPEDELQEEAEAAGESEETDAVSDGSADTPDDSSEEASSGGKKEGKFFKDKKKKKEDKREKQLLEQIADLDDKLKRQMAEFDNFRKRTEREKSAMFEIGAKDIIEKILPVVDNFERGLGAASEEERESAFVQGIEKIYKQLITALEDAGVKPIEAVGQEFDPNFHNAVMHAEDEEQGENIVTEEFQKGYLYRDSVIRYSMVKVVN